MNSGLSDQASENNEEKRAKLWSRSTILKNVTSTWASIIVGIAVGFVLAPITVRSLGSVYYGIWTLLMQLTGYLWLFDLGVRESVVKYVAQYQASDDRPKIISTVSTAVSMYSVVSLATLIMSVALAVALPYVFNIPADALATARLTTVLVGATVAQFFVFNVFVGVLMGLQKYYLMARIGMIFTLARGAVIYGLLSAGQGIVALALAQFAMTLVYNLIVVQMCRAHLPYLSIGLVWPRREEALKLLNYGKYVLIANVGDKVVFATDSIILGIFQPISALTYFAIGGSLIEYFRSFITSMASTLNPLSSSLEARNEVAGLTTVVMTGTRVAMLLGLPVCIGFMILGHRFIGLWVGPEYAGPAGLVLAVLASGHLLGLPYYTISAVLYGLGRHRIVAHSRILEGAANLILSVVLVRRFGIVGVAIGTVVPHVAVVMGILPPVLAKWVPIDLRAYYLSTYVRPFVAAVPFALVCWGIEVILAPQDLFSFMAYVIIGLVSYIAPCWFLVLSIGERASLEAAVRRRLVSRRAVEELS